MLRNLQKIVGYHLGATDGIFGKVREFYFDADHWTIRYVVADTGGRLAPNQVLISPFAVEENNDSLKTLRLRLTSEQVKKSPPIGSDQPISREFEMSYYQYYGWPMYWYGPALWGPGPYPVVEGLWPDPLLELETPPHTNPHLRSTAQVLHYHIHASDGDIGHVEDYILDDESWSIRYLEVATRNWLPGKKVLLPISWIKEARWEDGKVYVDTTRHVIKDAPEYRPGFEVSSDYEKQLQEYCNREGHLAAHI